MFAGVKTLRSLGRSSQVKVILEEYCLSQATRSLSTEAKGLPQACSLSGREERWHRWSSYPAILALAAFGTTYALTETDMPAFADLQTSHSAVMKKDWVQKLAAEEGKELILSAESMHTHPLLKADHMFSNLYHHQMVQDLLCFYTPSQQKLQYVIQLGRNVCGFPSIMHGGLTAAIVDECFGFLWLSLRANRQLTFSGPAFTGHLEVDYKQKIPAGRLLLCTTEVESCEGRKLWMKAEVRDGPTGKVYATARALFVRPRTQRLLTEGINMAYSFLKG